MKRPIAKRRAGRQFLQAADAAIAQSKPHVARLNRQIICAGEKLAIDDRAAADAGADRQVDHRIRATPRPNVILGQRAQIAIVLDESRNALPRCATEGCRAMGTLDQPGSVSALMITPALVSSGPGAAIQSTPILGPAQELTDLVQPGAAARVPVHRRRSWASRHGAACAGRRHRARRGCVFHRNQWPGGNSFFSAQKNTAFTTEYTEFKRGQRGFSLA